MADVSGARVKVHVRMEVDDGWPPVGVESLWAIDQGDGTVQLANTPWFAQGIASGDLLRVEVDADGLRWAVEIAQASGHCTFRLIVLRDGGSEIARREVLESFHRFGTTGEGIEQFGMVALDVPPDADYGRIRELLEHGEAQGWWEWDEGCATAAWIATAANAG